MLRAMLIDDEPLALEGLRLLIDWKAEGFEVCAECADARQALSQLPVARPDLIVTDIRLPGLDGLELMQAARQRGFEGQFVVVSGYGDFEYAKRALRIGVAGYLLKPVEPEEAAIVLEHVRGRLIDREAGAAEKRALPQRTLNALLAGCDAPADEPLPEGHWRLGTWGAPLPFEAVREILASFPEGEASAHIVEDKEFLALRWPRDAAEPDTQAAEALLARYRRRLLFGERTADPHRLAVTRAQLAARLALSCGSLTERVAALTRAVALRQPDECRARCAELTNYCDACGADVRARARQQLMSECARLFAERPEQLDAFLSAQNETFESLCLTAVRLLAPLQERVSDRVAAYVREQGGKKLTIESIASALNYNATYLGRVFRDEQGTGFREWLADQRVRQAAQMLSDTEECVCVIAEKVGYAQYKRFLQHFKQRYGVTPEQYRRQQAKR